VQYGGTGSYSEPYQPMQDITRLDETSKVYFVEENGEGYYQVYFGDGVLGYNLTPGDIVRARYLVTDGAAGNFSNLLTLTWNTDAILGETSLDRYIATISAPTGGQDAETTDQIKFHARNSYVSGNRTVTETDFANAIKDALPGLQSVSVWGGENSSPPRYGTVFISAKPYTGYVLTDAEKIKLVTDVLRPRSVVGLQYAFVDPEYTYIGVDVYLKYRTANTSRSAEQISALALQTVTNYFDNQLEKFNAGFYNSQLQEEIQNMDASIVSNILVLRQQKRIAPIPGTPFNVKLQFPGKIHPAELVSTYFYYYNGSNYYVAYIADAPDTSPPQYEGTGTINLYDAANNTIIDTLGTVSYGQAQVSINNLNISGYINDSVIRISTNLQETSRDLQPQYNEILVLDDTRGNGATAAINGVSVNVVSANI
jgi:hypothetical protein